MSKVLVTGGTGFIGSHTCVELINAGYEPVIVDNLYNSKEEVVDFIEQITGKRPIFYNVDVRDKAKLVEICNEHKPVSCIHFAGLKAVGESVEKPILYYDNNLIGTLALIEALAETNCKNIIFSSSATVYGEPKSVPILEDFPLHTTNPYGATKLMIEDILKDLSKADKDFKVTLLRYFNPIGAHPSGLIGESPNGIPNNLMPRIIQVAQGVTDAITIYGKDYPTPDGTGVRDYIHVMDLATGHIKAIDHSLKSEAGVYIYNLGTGVGYSVLDLVKTFEKVNNVKVPTVDCPRRAGDIPACYADATKAKNELGWTAVHSIEEMCSSSWDFAQKSIDK